MKRAWLGKAIIIVLLFSGVFFLRSLDLSLGNFQEEEPAPIEYALQDSGEIQVYFCPREDCEHNLTRFLDSAQKSIHCALYEVGLESVQQVLREKSQWIEVQVVTDNDYLDEFNESFVKADSWGLMHNKFCIVDGVKISTGSMNPTDNCAHKNNNHLLLVNSSIIAANYEDEFQEMWNGTFKKGSVVKNPIVRLGNTSIKMYFCPEDHCGDRVKDELKKAEVSIDFMIFSFTDESIANILILKKQENLTVRGVMEARGMSKDSQYLRLAYQGIDVFKDANKNNLHHKVFIIDNQTVIAGSFNPTGGGQTRNDENIFIITDPLMAHQFAAEFNSLYSQAQILNGQKTENKKI